MFKCRYAKVSEFTGNKFIGVAKFDDNNLGWSKHIEDTGLGENIRFNLDGENMFCISDNYPLTRASTAAKISFYDFNGNLKWKQTNQSQSGVVDYRRLQLPYWA